MAQIDPLDSSVQIDPPVQRAPAPTLLQVEQVTLQTRRGDVSLLQNISCSLDAGERVMLVGAAGSGKTLLFRLLTGLLSPTRGQILLQGQPITQLSGPELRRRVVWVPRLPRLLGMSVQEAIAYPLKLQAQPDLQIQQRLDSVLESLNLPLDWLAKGESGLNLWAQWQVTLARALVLQPQVLLLELPIAEGTTRTAVPQDAVAAIAPSLAVFQAQGGSVIMASRSPLGLEIASDADPKQNPAINPAVNTAINTATSQRWHLDGSSLKSLRSDEPWLPKPPAEETDESWGDEGEEF